MLGAATAFLILSFYAVVAGGAVYCAADTLVHGLPHCTAAVNEKFDDLLWPTFTRSGVSPGTPMLRCSNSPTT